MMNNWIYNGNEITEQDFINFSEHGIIGFVYIITDLETNMKYIGKKIWITTKKLPPLKGQKRKRKKIVETDWKTYHGSSEEVKRLVEEYGPNRFKREILYLCKSKGELSYLEMKEQIECEVLLKPLEYHNSFIGGKIHRNHVKSLIKG